MSRGGGLRGQQAGGRTADKTILKMEVDSFLHWSAYICEISCSLCTTMSHYYVPSRDGGFREDSNIFAKRTQSIQAEDNHDQWSQSDSRSCLVEWARLGNFLHSVPKLATANHLEQNKTLVAFSSLNKLTRQINRVFYMDLSHNDHDLLLPSIFNF